MDQKEFFNFINGEEVKTFRKLFGGYLAYGFEYGYVYTYGNKIFSMMDNDFKEDVKKSIESGENILLTYPEIKT